MLARNAESLYWIGRYVERADDTAGILDVTVHQLLEESERRPQSHVAGAVAGAGIDPPDTELDVWSLTDLVAFSRGLPGGCWIVDLHLGRARKRKVGKGSDVHGAVGV